MRKAVRWIGNTGSAITAGQLVIGAVVIQKEPNRFTILSLNRPKFAETQVRQASMFKRFEKWLRSIIAEEQSHIVAEVSKLQASFENGQSRVNASLTAMEGMHVEALRDLNTLEGMHVEALRILNTIAESQPTCCVEKHKLLVEMRDRTAGLIDSVERLHA
jgi:hypothetical protein